MPTAAVNGTDLFYEIDGESTPCLVLHGGLGLDHTSYRRTLGALSPPLQLVYLDHRGNGRSGRPQRETLTMEQLADDAVALADHLGFDRFVVLGHSYGGFIAQELATRHPARVSALVLVATTPGQLGTDESANDTEPGPPMPDALVEIFSTPPSDMAAVWNKAVPYYLHQADANTARSIFDDTVYDLDAMLRGSEIGATWSVIDRLGLVTAPTLLVAGRHDVITSWPQTHRIARHLPPGADIVVLDGSGHFPWLDEPDAFFAAVHRWLAAHA